MTTASVEQEARSIALSILRSNHLRAVADTELHQEWFHFWITAPNLNLLVNFSLAHQPATERGTKHIRRSARVVVLAREAQGWVGDAENAPYESVALPAGRVFAKMGEHQLEFEDGVFRIRGRLRRGGVSFDLTLTPGSFPSAANNTSLGEGKPSINWLVVPYLLASGTVLVGARSYSLSNAAAYHDHNWGSFTRSDLSWQWGHATDCARAEPISVVFARLLNRAQNEVHVQALLLWRGKRQLRVLRDAELHVESSGRCEALPFTVPRAAGLLLTDQAPHVPASLEVRARSGADEVVCSFRPEAIARIAVPDPLELGLTVIHETVGRLELEGIVRGERIELSATGVFEFLGRVA